jgi:hypothetical protein
MPNLNFQQQVAVEEADQADQVGGTAVAVAAVMMSTCVCCGLKHSLFDHVTVLLGEVLSKQSNLKQASLLETRTQGDLHFEL